VNFGTLGTGTIFFRIGCIKNMYKKYSRQAKSKTIRERSKKLAKKTKISQKKQDIKNLVEDKIVIEGQLNFRD